MHRSRRKPSLPIWVLFFLAMVTACSRRVDPRDRDAPATNTLGSIVAAAADGSKLRHVDPNELFATVRSKKQKGVLVNLWATWCGPCREELPMLAKVSKAYRERGITVLPLSVDGPDGQTKIAELLAGFGFEPPYYVVKPPMDAMKAALYTGWLGNIPASFLLDGSATRRYFFNAEVFEPELTPKLDALLAGTLAAGQSDFRVAPGQTL
jgi:thiol-disulfide isomerase/thioredoxin